MHTHVAPCLAHSPAKGQLWGYIHWGCCLYLQPGILGLPRAHKDPAGSKSVKSYTPATPQRGHHLVPCLLCWGREPSKPGRHPKGTILSAPARGLTCTHGSRGRGWADAQEMEVLETAQKPGLGARSPYTRPLLHSETTVCWENLARHPALGLKSPICSMGSLERTVCKYLNILPPDTSRKSIYQQQTHV